MASQILIGEDTYGLVVEIYYSRVVNWETGRAIEEQLPTLQDIDGVSPLGTATHDCVVVCVANTVPDNAVFDVIDRILEKICRIGGADLVPRPITAQFNGQSMTWE